MKDRYEGERGYQPDTPGASPLPDAAECSRLEEIGDLHYHASAYSSALDYYRQLLDDTVLPDDDLWAMNYFIQGAIGTMPEE